MTLHHGVSEQAKKDDELYEKIAIMAQNKRFQAAMFSLYGIAFNPPIGSYAMVMEANGQAENRVAMLDYLEGKFKDLAVGEIRVGNYLTQASIYFKESGEVVVESTNGQPVTVKGTNIRLEGNTTIVGTLNVPANSLIIGGVPFPQHTHSGVQTGTNTSGGVAT